MKVIEVLDDPVSPQTLSDLVIGSSGKEGFLSRFQSGLGSALSYPYRLAGKADVALGIKSPEVAESRAKTYGNVTRDVLEGALVPWSRAKGLVGLGLRGAQGAALGALQSPQDMATGAAAGVAGQVGGEAVTGLLRLARTNAKIAATALANYRNQLKNYTAKKEFDKSMTEALNDMAKKGWKDEVTKLRDAYKVQKNQILKATELQNTQQQKAFELAKGAHAETSAKSIMDDFKAQVSAWEPLPSTSTGIADAVYGKGPALASAKFDEAMKEAMEKGASIGVVVPLELADTLGIKTAAPELGETATTIPASDLMKAAIGKWKNPETRGAYRMAFGILDKAGVGNEEARGEYKAAQALIESVDRSRAFDKQGVFHPENLVGGLYKTSTVDILRKRGQGDVFTGPFQAARGAPVEPEPIKADIPPYLKSKEPAEPIPLSTPNRGPAPEEPEFTRRQVPYGKLGGGVVGGLLGSKLGHPYLGFGLGEGAGAALDKFAPFNLITKGPGIPEDLSILQAMIPGLMGVMGREVAE